MCVCHLVDCVCGVCVCVHECVRACVYNYDVGDISLGLQTQKVFSSFCSILNVSCQCFTLWVVKVALVKCHFTFQQNKTSCTLKMLQLYCPLYLINTNSNEIPFSVDADFHHSW